MVNETSSPTLSSPRNRYRAIIVGAGCFLLASVFVHADTSTTPPPGHIFALSDGADQTRTAKVNAAGELSAADSGTRSRLDTVAASLANIDGKLAATTEGLKVSATGHVSVDNLPAAMAIAGGVVSVGNFPPVQAVTGSVTISNVPATQDVNIVGGSAIANTTGGFGYARFELFNDGIPESVWLNAVENNLDHPTRRYMQLFPRGRERLITLITLNSDRDVHLTCRSHGVPMFVMANSSTNQRQEFVHPLQVDECYIACIQQWPEPPDLAPKCFGTFSVAGLGPSTYGPPAQNVP